MSAFSFCVIFFNYLPAIFSIKTKPIKKNEWKKLHFLQIIIPEPTD